MAHIQSTNSSPTGNPYLDSLIWGGKWVADSSDPGGASGPPQVTYYFASGPDPTAPKFVTKDWSDAQKDAVSSVLDLYSNIINVNFLEVSDPNQADDIERLTVGADEHVRVRVRITSYASLTLSCLDVMRHLPRQDPVREPPSRGAHDREH